MREISVTSVTAGLAVSAKTGELQGGTFTHSADGELSAHIHVTVGEKARSAAGYTSHLLSARVSSSRRCWSSKSCRQ